MSCINLLTNDVWSEQDILSRGRAMVAATVSEARQNDLRTIMLGHIAGMRTATPSEMGEIMQVRDLTEASALENASARADMALLLEVMAHEATDEGVMSEGAQSLYTLRNPEHEPVSMGLV